MRKLFLLLALFGAFAVGCESFNEILGNGKEDVNHTFMTDCNGEYIVNAEGGEVVVSISTDIEYDVIIPEGAQSWLSLSDTRAELRMERLTFIVAPNTETEERSADVELIDNAGNLLQVIFIKQHPVGNNIILYTTTDGKELLPNDTDASVFGAILQSNTYKDGQGVLVFDGDVTAIGNLAFCNCKTLASITIPKTVTYIGREAFGGCAITSITIPESVTTLGFYAFVYCNRLREFKGEFASDNGRCLIVSGALGAIAPAELKEYTIPASATTIGVGVFYGCDNLTKITIPESVTEIMADAFDGYTGSLVVNCNIPSAESFLEGTFWSGDFTSVTIGNNVTSVGDYAFNYCKDLTSVTIGNSVTTIGEWAFNGCSRLTSVTISDSVTEIGYGAFFNCTSLTSVYCKVITPPSLDFSVFEYYDEDSSSSLKIGCPIYVPTESVEAYKAADGWSEYADYIVGYEF